MIIVFFFDDIVFKQYKLPLYISRAMIWHKEMPLMIVIVEKSSAQDLAR